MGCGVGMESSEGMGEGMQYQALRKATGAVQGTAIDKVNQMTGVEDVPTHLDNSHHNS